jgi:hypothetical protein
MENMTTTPEGTNPMSEGIDTRTWNVVATVEKWDDSDAHDRGEAPDAVETAEHNLLLNEGIQLMLDLLIGASSSTYTNSTSFLGVGTSTTAASASQTALQAANNSSNKLYKVMDATYPSRASQTVTWKATFGSSDANFAWNEWSVARAASNPNSDDTSVGTNLNRKVTSFGTKSSGATWTLTVDITVS